MTIDEQFNVLQALKRGNIVEGKSKQGFSPDWCEVSSVHLFDFNRIEYRIKPKPREWWLIEDKTRDLVLDVWKQAPTIYDVTTFQRVIRVREVIE